MVSILIWPASPLFFVEALMATPLDILRLFVSISIVPALPVPDASVAMKPLPLRLMLSVALMMILPPLPVEEVEAEMEPLLLNSIFRSGLFL